MTATLFSDPLDFPVIKDRVRKRERIQGPRVGDWVIMLDGSRTRLTSHLGQCIAWRSSYRSLPIDAVPDGKDHIRHPSFGTEYIDMPGSYRLLRDGTISYNGARKFHNVSRRTKLVDTGQLKPAKFEAFEMSHPEIGMSEERFRATGHHGVDFELPCRVYRVSED